MKKFIIIILLALFILPGCKDFLDQAPTGEQEKGYIFEDYARARKYMDQLYDYLPRVWTHSNSYFSTSYPGFLESATDMAEYTASYGAANNSFNVGNWLDGSATREVSTPWSNSYNALRIAYMFLENMDQFNNAPEGRKTLMKGEVEFMIGFYYFDLLKRYGGVPLVKQTLDLESDMQLPRASYDETVDYIVENLNGAINDLPDEWPQDEFGRAHKATALALKSRVLLYAASPLNNPGNEESKWREAAESARDCIDYCDSKGMHQLFDKAYQNLFMRNYPENIPEIIMPTNWGSNYITFKSFLIYYGQATPGEGFQGYGSNTPTQNFVDRFEVIKYDQNGKAIGTEKFDWNNPNHVNNMYKNRDPRFYYSILYNDVYWIKRKIETWREGSTYGKDRNPKDHLFTKTGYYLRKFWPKECYSYEQPGSSQMTAFHIRYGEVILNYAEAMNELYGADSDNLGRGATITSRDAINRIRARLVCPPNDKINGEKDDFYAILTERQNNPDFPVLEEGMPMIPSGLDKTEMRSRIRNERTIELCFEGHYLYDILRWKEGKDLMGGAIYGVDVVKAGASFTYNRVKVEDRIFDEGRMYRYPIPRNQVYMMGIEQNPGW